MFTIATNGYDQVFADYLESHKNYASKYDYSYFALTKSPPEGISGTNSAWLKIPIILNALNKGYEYVFFVDADAKIREYAPSIDSVVVKNKSIYMSLGFSNKINSGVIIAKNSEDSKSFFNKIFLSSDLPGALLPKEDRNLYENGHVIYFGKRCSALAIIDYKWNNTLGKEIGEYIWHGKGDYHKKPRSKAAPLTLSQSLRKRISEGPRYFLLRRLAKFYESEYQF